VTALVELSTRFTTADATFEEVEEDKKNVYLTNQFRC